MQPNSETPAPTWPVNITTKKSVCCGGVPMSKRHRKTWPWLKTKQQTLPHFHSEIGKTPVIIETLMFVLLLALGRGAPRLDLRGPRNLLAPKCHQPAHDAMCRSRCNARVALQRSPASSVESRDVEIASGKQ